MPLNNWHRQYQIVGIGCVTVPKQLVCLFPVVKQPRARLCPRELAELTKNYHFLRPFLHCCKPTL